MVDFNSHGSPDEGEENEKPRRARQYSNQNWGPGARNRGQPPLPPTGAVLRRSLVRPGQPKSKSAPEDHDAVQADDDELAPPGRKSMSKLDAVPAVSLDLASAQPRQLASEQVTVERGDGHKLKVANHQLLLGLDDLQRAADLPDDPVFGAMAPGIVALLVGEAGVGKSTVMLAIAVAVAAGVPFAGITPPRPQAVVVYSPEDSSKMIGRRIKAACVEMRVDLELVKRNLHVVSDLEPFTLFDQDDNQPRLSAAGQRLIEAVQQVGARLVIPEPLIELHLASENDNGQMHSVFSTFRGLARELGCAILIGHHTTKDGGTPRGAGSIIGTIRFTMTAEHVTKPEAAHFKLLGKCEVDLFKLHLGKMSYERSDPKPIFFERVSHNFGAYSAPALRLLPW